MESLIEEQGTLSGKGDLSKIFKSVDEAVAELQNTRRVISTSNTNASSPLARLQNRVKQPIESMTPALRDVHKALGEYSKALDRKYKDKPLSPADHYTTSSQEQLVNRAIGMHFLREGQFAVAANFLQESLESELHQSPQIDRQSSRTPELLRSEILQKQFAEMYHILDEMKGKKNLLPATVWARANSTALEARGSNLEFDLVRLRFIWLFFAGEDASHGNVLALRQQSALAYARKEFGSFQDRYLTEIQQLIGAMAFCPNLDQSPYRQIFYGEDAWESLATSFTREFCSLLGLSADSPMYIAATAGAIALPTLQKLRVIMEKKRTEWTTHNELPVEIPLPPSYRFHSIFVCPVSKEQTTDHNPPMMMPCGHVVAQESLQRLSKVSRFKCPYCPGESHFKDAKKVFL